MISVTPNGRRAEEFAALLDGRGGDSARHRELLELVGAMRDVSAPEARPEYVADLRSRLMAEAEVALGEVERKLALPITQPGRRDRRIGIAAGAIALVGVTSSVAVASQGALPGDTLYPIKRAIEGASTSLTIDETHKAERILDNASGRLGEVDALVNRGQKGNAQLAATLNSFASQSQDGADLLLDDYATSGDELAIDKLRKFASDNMVKLSELSEKLPESVLEPLTNAVNVLTRIDDLAQKLCPACGGEELELPALLAQFTVANQTPSALVVPTSPVIVPTDRNETGGTQTDAPKSEDTPGNETDVPPPNGVPQDPTAPGTPKPKKDKPKGPISTLTDGLTGEGAPLGEDGLVDDLLTALLGNGLLG